MSQCPQNGVSTSGPWFLPTSSDSSCHHFQATTNDDQAAGAWTRALPISSILSQEKRQIQRKPGEELGLPVRSSPEVQIGQKSDTVSLPKITAEHYLTLNHFHNDEDNFGKA